MKKCPPGVICVENYSMFFIVTCVVVLFYIIYTTMIKQNVVVNNSPTEKIVIKDSSRENIGGFGFGGWVPSWPYTNLPSDPLLNPYAPPLRDERYFFNGVRPVVPINVSTNVGAVDTQYRQLGILTASNSKGKVIPLMGRPLFVNRDKWQYYTNSDQNNSMRLPISRFQEVEKVVRMNTDAISYLMATLYMLKDLMRHIGLLYMIMILLNIFLLYN